MRFYGLGSPDEDDMVIFLPEIDRNEDCGGDSFTIYDILLFSVVQQFSQAFFHYPYINTMSTFNTSYIRSCLLPSPITEFCV